MAFSQFPEWNTKAPVTAKDLKEAKKSKLKEPIIAKMVKDRNKAINTLNRRHRNKINPEREELRSKVTEAVKELELYMKVEVEALIAEAKVLPRVIECAELLKQCNIKDPGGYVYNGTGLDKQLAKYKIESSQTISKFFSDLSNVLGSYKSMSFLRIHT